MTTMQGSRRRVAATFATVSVVLLSVVASIAVDERQRGGAEQRASSARPKMLTLAVRDDYEKGDDLSQIARDFALCNELGVTEMFVNIGWDDYEPDRDTYDFAWLNEFVRLAAEHEINLRPYICYPPLWAADAWNAPPHDIGEWSDFCAILGTELRKHRNVLSYEIWLEQNSEMWWTGTRDQYKAVLKAAAQALRAADPDCQVLIGGLTFADYEWIEGCTQADFEQYYDVVPFHCYHETWGPEGVPLEASLGEQYREWFVPALDERGGGKTIWMTECGYSTLDRSEEQQANYIARAVSYFFADPDTLNRIDRFTYYELKDLAPGAMKIGDDHNYHFGLCRADGTKKLAFHTYRLLVTLLDGKVVVPADYEVTLRATGGSFGDEHHHLLKRSDGTQVLFLYDRENAVTCDVTLPLRGDTCTKWNLDGTSVTWDDFDGRTISDIPLMPEQVWIFEIG
jgi:hypothetical protein